MGNPKNKPPKAGLNQRSHRSHFSHVGNSHFPTIVPTSFPTGFPITFSPDFSSLQSQKKILMTRFTLSSVESVSTSTKRSAVVYLCNLSYPSELSDQIPYDQKCKMDSQQILSFYDVPVTGDLFPWIGCLWRVTARTHHPYKPYSRKEKKVSEIEAEFVRLMPND